MATVLESLEIEGLTSSAEFVAELPLPLPEAPESPICALVEAAKRGEEEAWERVIEIYGQVVYDTIRRRIKSDADADEVRQEVFLQALRKLPQLKEPQALGSWLRRIADRLAINYVTRRHAAPSLSERTWEESSDVRREPFAEVTRREAQEAVRQGLERLGPMDREALYAFYIEGKSLNEMSQEFAVPLGTVKRRLHVARKRLAQQLAGFLD